MTYPETCKEVTWPPLSNQPLLGECLHRCVMVLSVREAGRVQAVILIRSVFVSSSIIHVIILSAKRSHSFYAYNSSMAHFSGLWCKGGETGDIIFSTFPTPFTFSLLWCKNLIFITVLEKKPNDIWFNLYWFKSLYLSHLYCNCAVKCACM